MFNLQFLGIYLLKILSCCLFIWNKSQFQASMILIWNYLLNKHFLHKICFHLRNPTCLIHIFTLFACRKLNQIQRKLYYWYNLKCKMYIVWKYISNLKHTVSFFNFWICQVVSIYKNSRDERSKLKSINCFFLL